MKPLAKTVSLMAALVVALGLSACGKKAPLDDPPPKEKKQSDLVLPASHA